MIEKSSDGGSTWTVVNQTGAPSVLGFDHAGNILCASNVGLISKSVDGGQTWISVAQSYSNLTGQFAIDSKNNAYIGFAGNGVETGGILEILSSNSSSIVATLTTQVSSVAIGPDNYIYVAGPHVGTSGKPDGWQIQKTIDGKNWSTVDQFQSAGASAIVSVDPKGILLELGVGVSALTWVVRGFASSSP